MSTSNHPPIDKTCGAELNCALPRFFRGVSVIEACGFVEDGWMLTLWGG